MKSVSAIQNFLENCKSDNYLQLVSHMMSNLKHQEGNMNIKLHYLHSETDRFPKNLRDHSEEQDDRYHHDNCTMEEFWQGSWCIHMMTGYCWKVCRDLHTGTYLI